MENPNTSENPKQTPALHQVISFKNEDALNTFLVACYNLEYEIKKVFSRPDGSFFVDYIIPQDKVKAFMKERLDAHEKQHMRYKEEHGQDD